ncbi:MAG: hypothetical protein AB7N76_05270 [Planctomycetota bacterium]
MATAHCKHRNPDEDLRRLERLASAGDRSAHLRYLHHLARTGDRLALATARWIESPSEVTHLGLVRARAEVGILPPTRFRNWSGERQTLRTIRAFLPPRWALDNYMTVLIEMGRVPRPRSYVRVSWHPEEAGQCGREDVFDGSGQATMRVHRAWWRWDTSPSPLIEPNAYLLPTVALFHAMGMVIVQLWPEGTLIWEGEGGVELPVAGGWRDPAWVGLEIRPLG